MKTGRLFVLAGVIILGISGPSMLEGQTCPPAGSGSAGVATWIAENCGTCTNPATSCNGQFTVNLTGTSTNGNFITLSYSVTQIAGQNGLSHWGLGIGGLSCLSDGATICDLVVGGTRNGAPATITCGLDPTTQLFGVKFDSPNSVKNSTETWTLVLDKSYLASGWTIGVGCVPVAFKAGNQDIRPANGPNQAPSPGYACAQGPVCQEETQICYATETAWSAGPRYNTRGNWATYTAYNGQEKAVTRRSRI